MSGPLGDVLHASGPHPSLGDQAAVFDRFIGRWTVSYTHFGPDGSVREAYPGFVVFGWVLGGRAVQDVWVGASQSGNEPSMGTTIRFFDTIAATWRVVWIAPEGSTVATLTGGQVGDRIVLEGERPDGTRHRWSFNDLEDDRFVWRGERSEDNGLTWWRTAEYQFTRET